MKRSLIYLVTFFSIITIAKGQTKQLQFLGYSLIQYQQPVLVSYEKYEAYFKNMGDSREQGRIIINEKTKTFTIKWFNGDDWECKFTKKETKNQQDNMFGEVENTTYTGKWTDNNAECSLVIKLTELHGCITTLKSKKVIDPSYGIDTWKKIFTFGTAGNCFE